MAFKATLTMKTARVTSWMAKNPCPQTGTRERLVHRAILSCANTCALSKVSTGEAADFIRRYTEGCGRAVTQREINEAIATAYNTDFSGGNGSAEPRAKVEPFKPELMAESAAKVPFEVTPDWLVEVSPECVLDVTPSQYLDAVFRPEENVAVKVDKLDRGLVYQVGDYESAARLNRYVKTNTAGAWYYTNPVDGQYNLKPDGNRGGCYGDDRITDWRYLLLESDHEGFEQHWLNIVVQLKNIVALYTSGNVSVHALVRVNATSKDEFNRIADQYKRLVQVGACEGSLSATRATRLPGVIRGDNGREQRLLYLAPNPDSQTIYQKETTAGNHADGRKHEYQLANS
jgi:hypothetical protein